MSEVSHLTCEKFEHSLALKLLKAKNGEIANKKYLVPCKHSTPIHDHGAGHGHGHGPKENVLLNHAGLLTSSEPPLEFVRAGAPIKHNYLTEKFCLTKVSIQCGHCSPEYLNPPGPGEGPGDCAKERHLLPEWRETRYSLHRSKYRLGT